jgi:hypothetical protein
MTEKIEEIAKSIKKHRELEINGSLSNPAIGRFFVLFKREYQVFWLTNKENISGQNIYDFNGNIVGRNPGFSTTLTTHGRAIYKNTKVGEILILNHEGKHIISVPQGSLSVELFNRTSYVPSNSKNDLATDLLIKLSGDSRTHSYQNISKIFHIYSIKPQKMN